MNASQRLMDTLAHEAKHKAWLAGRHDASELFEYLMERVEEFQKSLSDDEEIGLALANFGKAAEIHIRSIGYKNPNLIEFSGLDAENNEVTLLQHISQLNFLLTALKPVEEKPFRMGFTG